MYFIVLSIRNQGPKKLRIYAREKVKQIKKKHYERDLYLPATKTYKITEKYIKKTINKSKDQEIVKYFLYNINEEENNYSLIKNEK